MGVISHVAAGRPGTGQPPTRRTGRRSLSRAARLLASLLVGVLLVLLTGPAALAHDELVFSSPGARSVTPMPPAEIVLRFDQPVDPALSTVAVRGPDGVDRVDGPPALGLDGSLVVALTQDGSEGAWAIDYRVVATDGHPVTGTVEFSVGSRPATFASSGVAGWKLAVAAFGALALAGVVLARVAVARSSASVLR